jgi:hypothetical protein
MKKAGYIVSLVAVILDSVISGLIGLAMFSYGIPVLGLIITAIVIAEIIAIVNYKKADGWPIFLLVLGALTIILSLNSEPPSLSITGVALLVGPILTLISKNQKEVTPQKTYTLEEVKALLEKEKGEKSNDQPKQ